MILSVRIDIDNPVGTAGVTLTKVNSYYSGEAGILVDTNGALHTRAVRLKNNKGNGISLYNEIDIIPKAVVLSDLYI